MSCSSLTIRRAAARLLACELSGVVHKTVPLSWAGSAAEALERADGIDVVLTDVVLPDMSGPALAKVLCRQNPSLQVLYMSGYSEGQLEKHGVPEHALIQKPFDADQLISGLAERIRQPS